MSDMTVSLKPSLAASPSIIVFYSLVRDPDEMMSKRHLESVSNCSGTCLSIIHCNSCLRAMAASNISANAITSELMGDFLTLLALYDLKIRGVTFSVLSDKNTIYPNWDERSRLLLKDASEKPTIRRYLMSSFSYFRLVF